MNSFPGTGMVNQQSMPETRTGIPGIEPPPLARATLYLVSTPIGNLEDITLRALRVLREVDMVFCEDTRRTGLLLRRLGIGNRLASCHRFNERERQGRLLECLGGGGTVALVSDAGTPGIRDPGERLVRAVWEAGFRVEGVPGACAAISALSISGLATDTFHFAGFLPVKRGRRERMLQALSEIRDTLVLYESPYRIHRLAGELLRFFGNREVAVCRELTKLHEEVLRGPIPGVAEELAARKPRGEYVVVVGPEDSRLPHSPEQGAAIVAVPPDMPV